MSPNELLRSEAAAEPVRRERSRWTAFDCDPDQLAELLRFHGLSAQVCDKLKSKLAHSETLWALKEGIQKELVS